MKEIPYHQLDWWGQRNEDVDGAAKAFLRQCTSGPRRDRRVHIQPILQLGKRALAHNGNKLTSICRDALYNNLYGPRTLDYWADKDDIPKDATRILWEELLQAMKRVSRAHRRIDTKLPSNNCGFVKTIFDRQQQDTHNCPVCNEPREDRNHMFTCQAPSAIANREQNLK